MSWCKEVRLYVRIIFSVMNHPKILVANSDRHHLLACQLLATLFLRFSYTGVPDAMRSSFWGHAALVVEGKQQDLPKIQCLLGFAGYRLCSHPLSSIPSYHSWEDVQFESWWKWCFNRLKLRGYLNIHCSWQIFIFSIGSFIKILHVSKLLCETLIQLQ